MTNNFEPLPVKNSEDLRTVCESLKLGDCFERIEEITCHLQHFERFGKAAMKSARGQTLALQKVATAARNLAAAINELDYSAKFDIGSNLPPDGLTTACQRHFEITGATVEFSFETDGYVRYSLNLGGRVGHIGIEADRLSKYCDGICQEENASGVKGGRKPTLDRYASAIRGISEAVRSRNIKPGRGGVFEELCEAVFIAAGVQTGPEGAIRRYLEQCKAAENTSDDQPF